MYAIRSYYGPWFIISLPLASVIAGLSTFIIANHHHQDLVAEDYYQRGKAINQDLRKQQAALAAGIGAELLVQQGDLVLTLRGQGLRPNEALRLSLFHATQAARDTRYLMTADAAGRYRFRITSYNVCYTKLLRCPAGTGSPQ